MRNLAASLLRIYGLCMPLMAFANCAYFTLRSGGKVLMTFMFDDGHTWAVAVPLAWSLVHLTGMDILAIYLCIQLADIVKVTIGYILIKKGIWVHNIVGK